MTITLVLPAIIAILGLLLYFFSDNVKRQEVGKIMFAAGVFAICFGNFGEWTGVRLRGR